jgi:assimilatory nitrate reductase catalytic subunit
LNGQPRGDLPQRLFADGRFPTSDGRARFVATPFRAAVQQPDAQRQFVLNSGRIRDQWHTMTRTGLAPGLARHIPEPYVEIHPLDAALAGVVDGKLTCVESARGEVVAVARVTDRQRRGSVFLPMHWSDAFAPSGRANAATSPAVDPVSGQPEFKHTPARIYGYRETWAGFYLARTMVAAPSGIPVIWRRIPHAGAQLHEFAGRGDESERQEVARVLLKGASGECLRFEDSAAQSRREAWIVNGRLERVYFAGARLPPRDWLAAAFLEETVSDETRRFLLHGRAPGAALDTGPLVCACAGVSTQTILGAIAAGASTLEAVAERTRAGATCGSCRPTLLQLIATAQTQETRDAA